MSVATYMCTVYLLVLGIEKFHNAYQSQTVVEDWWMRWCVEERVYYQGLSVAKVPFEHTNLAHRLAFLWFSILTLSPVPLGRSH